MSAAFPGFSSVCTFGGLGQTKGSVSYKLLQKFDFTFTWRLYHNYFLVQSFTPPLTLISYLRLKLIIKRRRQQSILFYLIMTEIKESVGRALEEARQFFAMDYPVVNFVIGILVAYVVLYFITFYLGPVLFGVRPIYRPWPIARTMHHVTRRAADIDLDGEFGSQLTAKVTSSIQKWMK